MDNSTFTVFTYGTLMKGFEGYEKYLKNSTFLGCGTINGKMYHTNSGYPVVIKSSFPGENRVKGELFEVDKNTMIKLRNYEGIYSFFTYYTEEILPVTLEDGSVKYARVFVAHPFAKPFIRLTSKKVKHGDWRRYISVPKISIRRWVLTALLILINCILLFEAIIHS